MWLGEYICEDVNPGCKKNSPHCTHMVPHSYKICKENVGDSICTHMHRKNICVPYHRKRRQILLEEV